MTQESENSKFERCSTSNVEVKEASISSSKMELEEASTSKIEGEERPMTLEQQE